MGFKFNPITGYLDLVGSASAVPPGTPNTFAGYDATGVLESIGAWTRNPYKGASIYQNPTITDPGSSTSFIFNQDTIDVFPTNNLSNSYLYGKLDTISLTDTFDYLGVEGYELSIAQIGQNNITGDLVVLFPRVQMGVGGGSNSSINDWVIKSNIRLSGGHVAQNITGIESQVSLDGATTVSGNSTSFSGSTYIGGTSEYAYGLNQSVQIAGALNQYMYGIYSGMLVEGPATANNAQNITGYFNGNLSGNYQGISSFYVGDIGGSSTDLNIYHEGIITNNSQMIAVNRNGASLDNLTVISVNLNGSSPVSGDFRHMQAVNDSDISNNGAGILINQNGSVAKSWTGFGSYVNADVGDGTSYIVACDLSFQNHTLAGSVYGVNFNNNSNITGTNNITGYSVNNGGTGYRFIGFNAYNNQDMTEEIRGFQFNSQSSDARTGAGLDIFMSGAFIDDVYGSRIDVNNVSSSSTSQHVISGTFSGGVFQVQSAYTPFSGIGFDIGNNLTVTASIISGSPLTGTDQILTLLQPNLIVGDDISPGPFGLDTTMVGIASQIDVGSGKTVPLLRTMLLGTTVPSGSGGTITEHIVLEILGLPSFGGSVTCPTKIGIQDAQLVGQNFSDGATDAWGIKWRDANSEHYLARLAINTASFKVANANVGIELEATDKAVLLSRMTSAQRTAMTPINGMIIFNTDLTKLEYYDGTVWVAV